MKLYIDNVTGTDDFGNELKYRLKYLEKIGIEICDYDILTENKEGEVTQGEICEKMEESDIIIPVITPYYISKSEDLINSTLDKIVYKNDKYVFPIIYSPSDWSSKNWIVRSSILPKGNKSVIELDIIEKERLLKEIVQNIENILNKKTNIIEDINLKEKFIFISHSHTDADFAELVKLKLENEGLRCWVDEERLKIGQDWRQEIDEGIENCVALIVIMSPEAKLSEYVTYEWSFAWGKQKKIFPILLKQTNLHPRLESLQYLDFTKRSLRPWSKLMKTLKEL